MSDKFVRTEMLIGKNALTKLSKCKVAIFGVGGVGGYVAEILARCNVGQITLIDNDVVSKSNINRQIVALENTIGMYKTEAMAQRILQINDKCKVKTVNEFYLPQNKNKMSLAEYDYVIDAIDTVSAKIDLAQRHLSEGFKLISSLGTGNKLDPTKFEITDINKTSVCPLARIMRSELKKRNVSSLTVIYSTEQPQKCNIEESHLNEKGCLKDSNRPVPASIAFVPSIAGILIARYVVLELIKDIEQSF